MTFRRNFSQSRTASSNTTTIGKFRSRFPLGLTLGLISAAGGLYWTFDRLDGLKPKLIQLDASDPQLSSEFKRNVQAWRPRPRFETLDRLQKAQKPADAEYDLLIIGGGATGVGVALDAATRGLKVALVEKDDFSAGTSSRSTKLVHGGVRYLEKAFFNLDRGQYDLVQEALHERFTFLNIAPYLATELPIMCPLYKWWQVPYYYLGTKAYDFVAGKRGLESSYYLTKHRALQEFPMLKTDDLIGAVVYYDGQQNDSRMNVALAKTAEYYGADIANHVEVVSLHKTKLEDGEEKLHAATVRDTLTGKEWQIRAKGIVNATGPFADLIRKMDEPDCKNLISPSSGTHIILPHYFSPEHMGLIDPATSDGRVIFFLPWEGNTIAGTTDTSCDLSFNPKPTEKEIEFILNEVSHYLDPDIKVRRGDVLAAWAGIRPLVRNPNAANTSELVRNHLLYFSKSDLLTITGGKWTTYREMAEETVDAAIERFGLSPKNGCVTENTLLIGSHGYNPKSYIRLIQQFGMETEVAQHLVHNYGDRAAAVAALAAESGQRWPVMGKRLAYPYLFIEAEVRYAVQREYASTAVDVLARRTRLAFLNAHAANDCLPRVIEIMAEELKWNKGRKQQELKEAKEFLMTMGLDEHSSRSLFKSEEIIYLREKFQKLDVDGDGAVNRRDLQSLVKSAGGKPLTDEQIAQILDEVDSTRSGAIRFSDFLEVMTLAKNARDQSKFAQLIDNPSTPGGVISTERSGGGV